MGLFSPHRLIHVEQDARPSHRDTSGQLCNRVQQNVLGQLYSWEVGEVWLHVSVDCIQSHPSGSRTCFSLAALMADNGRMFVASIAQT